MNNNDKNLVQGHGQFKVFEEISSLQFVVHSSSPCICKSCVAKQSDEDFMITRRKLARNFLMITVRNLQGRAHS